MTTNTTNSAETKTPGKRGRKKIEDGGKASPRKIFCSCAALVAGELVLEEVECLASGKDSTDEQIVDEAAAIFEAKHGVEPEVVGPHFQRKGVSIKKKRDSLNLSMDKVEFIKGRTATAVYKNWNVTVRFVEDNTDAAYIMYKSHQTDEKKTSKPSNKFVRISALENLKEVKAQAASK